MESIFEKLVVALLGGGPQGLIAILCLIIALLIVDRKRILKEVERKDEKIEKIVDDYYTGNKTLGEALTSLKLVLIEIKAKI
ncbi:MAG: hypothetical protein EOO77_26865 [Oxalobacteraceae bacterium]|nr:MAG: hypothetical protein EOO77_26865 [Oxalobacteraceae bacterium]